MLLDHVVHVLVALDERRPEVERRDVADVVQVLRPPGLVEVELPVEVRLDGGRDGTLRHLERVPLDELHQEERHEDHEEQDGNRPEDPPDDECEHRLVVVQRRRR